MEHRVNSDKTFFHKHFFMSSIFHIMVLWSNATQYKEAILEDLRASNLHVYRMFDVRWDKDAFLDNYIVFYAHSQKHLAYDKYKNLLRGKMTHCGDGRFFVIILKDDTPIFENRGTSSGDRLVNTRVYDKKVKYREMTGGGHKIHSSDDAWETNKDLTLMFGLNTDDFLKRYPESDKVETYEHNCVGVGGYNSIEEFFYVLNNTVEYVVMRNFECIPDEYTVEGHGDIDLLVENLNYVRYLTLARPIFEEAYRVYHEIVIAGKSVPFDFRHVGDNYYDRPWQTQILAARVKTKDLFYIPDAMNLYLSLLYHAYVQKNEVKEDYHPKLSEYASRVGLTYVSTVKDCMAQLDMFMRANQYEYVVPKDKSVVYNKSNVAASLYALRHGQFIKRNSVDDGCLKFKSSVYEKEDSFVKVGTDWLIENEAKYLRLLSGVINVPKVIDCQDGELEGDRLIEISRCAGVDFIDFFADVNHQRPCFLKSFLIRTILMLKKLNKAQIAHRDLQPSNFIINDAGGLCHVSLIDFGWAAEAGKINELRPMFLCERYAAQSHHTDAYAVGSFILDYWCDMPYVRSVSAILRSVEDADKQDAIEDKLNKALRLARYAFTPYDSWRLLCRRHLRIGWVKQALNYRIRGIFR